MSASFDLIVVGLGAAGSAAAWQAAKRGARVLGIDRHSPPHPFGSSHGDTRITREAIGEGEAYTPLVRRANRIWREVEALTGERLGAVTGGLWISSGARLAETHVPEFFAKTLAAARRFGIAHETLDASAIRRRFPQFKVADNEVGYYEPGAGYLRPEACVRAQLALAASRGAELKADEAVLEVSQSGGTVRARTARGTYEAPRLLLCAGAWLPAFLDAPLARRFAVTRQAIYWFEVRAPIERFEAPRFPVWIWELQDRGNVIYGFPVVDGPAGGLKVATEQYAETTTADTVVRDVSEEERRAMHANLIAPYLPEIGPRCLRAQACLYTATPDFQFAIGPHPRMPHVMIGSACSGHGFKHSAAVGEALAELALEGRSTMALEAFRLDRACLSEES